MPLVVDDLVELAEGICLLFNDLAVEHCQEVIGRLSKSWLLSKEVF